jgi:hypothetical protein
MPMPSMSIEPFRVTDDVTGSKQPIKKPSDHGGLFCIKPWAR